MTQRKCHTCGKDVSELAEERLGLLRRVVENGKPVLQELDFCSPKCLVTYVTNTYPDVTGN